MNTLKSVMGGLKRDLLIVINRVTVTLLIICFSTTAFICFFGIRIKFSSTPRV